MSNQQIPRPQTQAPELSFHLTNGETWSLKDQSPETFTMIVFYRGLHCPVCKSYTAQLNKLLEKYHQKGVEPVAVSMDSKEKAEQTVQEWEVDNLDIGYELTEKEARDWGLFLSHGIKDEEPALFSEPGLFLIRPDSEIYYVAVNSMPFGRPDLEAMLGGIDFVTNQNYPARGEVE